HVEGVGSTRFFSVASAAFLRVDPKLQRRRSVPFTSVIVVPIPGRRGCDQRPEQPVRLFLRACGEEQRGLRSSSSTVTELKRPQTVDPQLRSICAVQEATKPCLAVSAGMVHVEGLNSTIAEVADQEIATELPKAGRCHCQAPG